MAEYYGATEGLGLPSPFATMNLDGGSVDYAKMNEGVHAMFEMVAFPDYGASEESGHPVYRDIECVRITVAGDKQTEVIHPVRDGIKRRFPDEYRAWKAGQEAPLHGAPLKEWTPLPASRCAEFVQAGIRTVEELAKLPDHIAQRHLDGAMWRSRAQAWLEQARSGSAVLKLAAENDRLKEEVARLAEMMERFAGGETAKPRAPRKRGRRPHAKAAPQALAESVSEA